jgi:hypothetical protein
VLANSSVAQACLGQLLVELDLKRLFGGQQIRFSHTFQEVVFATFDVDL